MGNDGWVSACIVPYQFPITHIPSYEFATNEFVNTISCVTLETSSTENGIKDFIAVGTTINRGEDLAAKGSVSSVTVPYQAPLIHCLIDLHF